MIRFVIGFGIISACLALAQAENTRPADTPPIVQVTLGPDYRDLPEDGGQYCVPTAHTMGLFWLNTMGFTTLAPTFSEAEGYNLDRIIAGLMGTGDGTHGGTTGAGASAGMELYFNLKGLSGNFSGTSIPQPTGAELGSTLVGTYDFAVINIGWFRQSGTSSTYVQNSGHVLRLARKPKCRVARRFRQRKAHLDWSRQLHPRRNDRHHPLRHFGFCRTGNKLNHHVGRIGGQP